MFHASNLAQVAKTLRSMVYQCTQVCEYTRVVQAGTRGACKDDLWLEGTYGFKNPYVKKCPQKPSTATSSLALSCVIEIYIDHI